jgi:hypothetical protein
MIDYSPTRASINSRKTSRVSKSFTEWAPAAQMYSPVVLLNWQPKINALDYCHTPMRYLIAFIPGEILHEFLSAEVPYLQLITAAMRARKYILSPNINGVAADLRATYSAHR